MERIVEYRAYAGTKAAYDHTANPKAKSDLWRLVERITFELAREEINGQRADD